MYKISSELLIKVTKAIDKVVKKEYNFSFRDSKSYDDLESAISNLKKVNEEIKEKYDLTGYKK